MCLVPATGGSKCLYLSQTWCVWSVHVCLLANIKQDQPVIRRGLVSGLGYQAGQGSVLVCPRGLTNMVCVRDEYVRAAHGDP